MLSNDVYKRAQKQLECNPTYLKLLNALWPLVKDHDFTKIKYLTIVKPNNVKIIRIDSQTSFLTEIEYSHRAYSTVLTLLGLTCSSNFAENTLRIRR